jgi:hypothetical protein
VVSGCGFHLSKLYASLGVRGISYQFAFHCFDTRHTVLGYPHCDLNKDLFCGGLFSFEDCSSCRSSLWQGINDTENEMALLQSLLNLLLLICATDLLKLSSNDFVGNRFSTNAGLPSLNRPNSSGEVLYVPITTLRT